MTTALVFVIGLAAIGGVLVWLARTNSADATRITEALGLQPTRGTAARGDDPLLGRYSDHVFATGQVHGWDTVLARRVVYRTGRHITRNRSHQIVLHMTLPRPARALVRVEPARTGTLAAAAARALGGGTTTQWPEVATGDVPFDAAYRVTAPDAAAAVTLLPPNVRSAMLAARAAAAPTAPTNAAGRVAADLVGPTFAVDHGRATCTLNGTPTARLLPALEAAAAALAHLAHAATTPARD